MTAFTSQEEPERPGGNGAAAAAVLRRLALFKRRATQVLAVKYGCVAAIVAVACAEVGALASGAGAATAASLLGLMLLAGLSAAIVAALLRAPTLEATAAAIDRRQQLANHATTALQVVAERDPVAQLVLRDAAERLGACTPAHVFPIEYPSRWPWLVAGLTAASLLFAVSLQRPRFEVRGVGQSGGASAGSSRPQPSSNGAAAAARSPNGERAADAHIGSRGAPAPARPSPAAGEAPAPGQSAPEASRPASGAVTAAAGSTAPAASPSRASRAAGVAAPGESGSGTSRDAALAAAGSAAGGSGRGAGITAKGGGSGDGPATARSQQGGGVRGGALIRNGNDARAAAPRAMTSAEAARYRADWAHAQAAVGQRRVPAALRQYVRDYFAAIRSPGPR